MTSTSHLQRTTDIDSRPADIWTTITPNDSTDIPLVNKKTPRGIYADGAGDIVMIDKEGNEATFAFGAAEIRPLRPVRIKATGTTATGIIGLW